MPASLVIHSIAQQEIDRALNWYAKRSLGVAHRLRDLVRSSLNLIQESPESWSIFHDTARGYQLKGFPYMFVYSLGFDRILIVAFQHTSGRPGYWRNRWLS